MGLALWRRAAEYGANRHGPAPIGLVLFLAVFLCNGCEKEKDMLSPNISVSGKVTNNSGHTGTIIVEIDYNLRDTADSEGRYSIGIHKDFFIDSLYAWVDQDGNNAYTQGEPFGFYRSSSEPDRAKTIHARSTDIGNINLTVP